MPCWRMHSRMGLSTCIIQYVFMLNPACRLQNTSDMKFLGFGRKKTTHAVLQKVMSIGPAVATTTACEFALKHITIPPYPEGGSYAEVQQEVKVMEQLKGHANILCLHAVAYQGPLSAFTHAIILLELCPVTLESFMQPSKQRLDDKLVCEVFSSVCQAVLHMHQQSPAITHRDLKVENVLKTRDGRWVLADFGSATTLAKTCMTSAEIALQETVIQRTTTPAYRAPEDKQPSCILAHEELNHAVRLCNPLIYLPILTTCLQMWDILLSGGTLNCKSDIWALGVLLYNLCFSTLPFLADSKLAVMHGKYTVPVNTRPAPLIDLIRQMLTVDSALRPDITAVIELFSKVHHAASSPGELGGGEMTLHQQTPAPVQASPALLNQQQQLKKSVISQPVGSKGSPRVAHPSNLPAHPSPPLATPTESIAPSSTPLGQCLTSSSAATIPLSTPAPTSTHNNIEGTGASPLDHPSPCSSNTYPVMQTTPTSPSSGSRSNSVTGPEALDTVGSGSNPAYDSAFPATQLSFSPESAPVMAMPLSGAEHTCSFRDNPAWGDEDALTAPNNEESSVLTHEIRNLPSSDPPGGDASLTGSSKHCEDPETDRLPNLQVPNSTQASTSSAGAATAAAAAAADAYVADTTSVSCTSQLPLTTTSAHVLHTVSIPDKPTHASPAPLQTEAPHQISHPINLSPPPSSMPLEAQSSSLQDCSSSSLDAAAAALTAPVGAAAGATVAAAVGAAAGATGAAGAAVGAGAAAAARPTAAEAGLSHTASRTSPTSVVSSSSTLSNVTASVSDAEARLLQEPSMPSLPRSHPTAHSSGQSSSPNSSKTSNVLDRSAELDVVSRRSNSSSSSHGCAPAAILQPRMPASSPIVHNVTSAGLRTNPAAAAGLVPAEARANALGAPSSFSAASAASVPALLHSLPVRSPSKNEVAKVDGGLVTTTPAPRSISSRGSHVGLELRRKLEVLKIEQQEVIAQHNNARSRVQHLESVVDILTNELRQLPDSWISTQPPHTPSHLGSHNSTSATNLTQSQAQRPPSTRQQAQ